MRRIYRESSCRASGSRAVALLQRSRFVRAHESQDRKSTRLNSSHSQISYAVFCLKKKKNIHTRIFCHTELRTELHADAQSTHHLVVISRSSRVASSMVGGSNAMIAASSLPASHRH